MAAFNHMFFIHSLLFILIWTDSTWALSDLKVLITKSDYVLEENIQITVKLSADLRKPVLIRPNYEWNWPLLDCKSCQAKQLQFANQSLQFDWTCTNPGAMVIFFTAHETIGNTSSVSGLISSNQTDKPLQVIADLQVNTQSAFVELNIGRSSFLHTISWAFGWCYFLSWILSMYPQCIINYKRKSVVGLNFDYVALCLVGYISYAIFNVCFTWVPLFRETYQHQHPHSNIPVQINDVLFSLHGVAATTVLAIQCAIYERGDQRICDRVHAILISVYSPSIVLSVMLLCSQLQPLSYIYFFSYVKMTLTIAKYIPQAVFNYRRKSTAGWSIHNILLDWAGGLLSLLQMACLAVNFDDINYFTYNIAKFGIGVVTLVFDTIFIIQHYCLYGDRHSLQEEDRSSQSESECMDNESGLTVITNSCSIRKSPHSLASKCGGCCTCIPQTNSVVSRAIQSQLAKDSNILNKHLAIKANEKETQTPNAV